LTKKDQKDIANYIKDAIIHGKWKQGERIVETQLCREIKVGRSKVRIALKQLEQEGFIEIIPNSGAVVKKLSQRDMAQIFDIMGALEGLAARVATPVMGKETIDQIEERMVNMEENQDNKFLLFQNNLDFHNLLSSSNNNPWLIDFMTNMRKQTHRMSLQSFHTGGQIKATIKEHRAIVNAIKERKPQRVENLIRKHYQGAKDRLIRFMNASL